MVRQLDAQGLMEDQALGLTENAPDAVRAAAPSSASAGFTAPPSAVMKARPRRTNRGANRATGIAKKVRGRGGVPISAEDNAGSVKWIKYSPYTGEDFGLTPTRLQKRSRVSCCKAASYPYLPGGEWDGTLSISRPFNRRRKRQAVQWYALQK
jgi:hypothetical protein